MSEVVTAPAVASEAPAESPITAPIEGAAPVATEVAPKPDTKKTFKYVVDGEEVEDTIDLSDEKAIREHLQRSKVTQKRMQEAGDLRRNVENFIKALKNDPFSVLQDKSIGLDVKKLVNDYVERELKEAEKSPEQKQQEALMREVEQLRREKEDAQKSKENEEILRFEQQYATELNSDIITALDSDKSLPKTPYTIKRVAEALINAHNLAKKTGYNQPIKVKDVMPYVKERITKELQDFFTMSPEDTIEFLLGQQNLERMRTHRLKKSKQAPVSATSVRATNTTPKDDKPAASEKIPLKQFFKNLGK